MCYYGTALFWNGTITYCVVFGTLWSGSCCGVAAVCGAHTRFEVHDVVHKNVASMMITLWNQLKMWSGRFSIKHKLGKSHPHIHTVIHIDIDYRQRQRNASKTTECKAKVQWKLGGMGGQLHTYRCRKTFGCVLSVRDGSADVCLTAASFGADGEWESRYLF